MSAFRRLAVVIVPALIAACSSDTTAPTASGLAGTYTLVKANGTALPAIVDANAEDTLRVTSGTVRIHSNSTWAVNLALTSFLNGAATQSDTGSFSISGDTVTFTSNTEGAVIATVSGSSVTVHSDLGNSAQLLLFQKQ